MPGNRGPTAREVHLNLKPGLVDPVTEPEVLLGAVPVPAATVMQPPADCVPPRFAGDRVKLGPAAPALPAVSPSRKYTIS